MYVFKQWCSSNFVIFLWTNRWTFCWLITWLDIHGSHAMTVHIHQDFNHISLVLVWILPDSSTTKQREHKVVRQKQQRAQLLINFRRTQSEKKKNAKTVRNKKRVTYWYTLLLNQLRLSVFRYCEVRPPPKHLNATICLKIRHDKHRAFWTKINTFLADISRFFWVHFNYHCVCFAQDTKTNAIWTLSFLCFILIAREEQSTMVIL